MSDLFVSKLTWIVSLSVGFFGVTPTFAVSEREPPAPAAVRVYRVVLVGQTCLEPLESTFPTPLSIDTVVAFEVDQLSVEQAPSSIEEGEAENEIVGAAAGGGVRTGSGAGAGFGLAGHRALILPRASAAMASASGYLQILQRSSGCFTCASAAAKSDGPSFSSPAFRAASRAAEAFLT